MSKYTKRICSQSFYKKTHVILQTIHFFLFTFNLPNYFGDVTCFVMIEFPFSVSLYTTDRLF